MMIEPVQQRLARLAGLLYLVQMATGIFGESYVRNRLITRNAAETAANLAASERLFRISIAGDLLTYLTVIVLLWAIYVILRPVNSNLALLAAFLRLAENAILAAGTMNAFMVLRLLSGAEYLQPVDDAHLQSLARAFLSIQGAGMNLAFVFTGAGSAIFSYVWLKSGYIPKALAILGIFASSVLALFSFANIVFPAVWTTLGLTYMVPMFFYEVGLGLWLLIKGLRSSTAG